MIPEGGPRNTGQTEETVHAIQIIELPRTMFAEGSLGSSLFPRALEGRKRAETTFGQPLESLFRSRFRMPQIKIDISTLNARGISTVSDILSLPSEDEKLQGLNNPGAIKKRLSEYLEDLVQTPHGKLLEKVFGFEQRKDIPPEREQELIDAVNNALDDLTENQKRTVQLRFGLINGTTKTLRELGEIYSVTKDAILSREETALRKLKGPHYSPSATLIKLKQYLTLPKNTFAEQAFGHSIVFQKDLPPLPNSLLEDNPNLSASTREELNLYGVFSLYPEINDVALADIGSFPLSDLSEKAREEIKEALRKGAEDFAKQEEEKEELARQQDIFVAPEKPKPVNNLLPEIAISETELVRLADFPIANLELSARARNALLRSGYNTVGDLLTRTPEEIWQVRNFHLKSVDELAKELTRILQLPEERHSEIPNLFLQANRKIPPGVEEKYLSAEARSQELLLKAQEADKENMEKIREIISQANTAGFTSAEQILKFVKRQNIRVIGNNPYSFVTQAIIEYALKSHSAS